MRTLVFIEENESNVFERTEYETYCATRQKVHEVEDDVVECR